MCTQNKEKRFLSICWFANINRNRCAKATYNFILHFMLRFNRYSFCSNKYLQRRKRKEGSKVDKLDYNGNKEEHEKKRKGEIMAVALSMVVIVQQVDESWEHRKVISIRLTQILDQGQENWHNRNYRILK